MMSRTLSYAMPKKRQLGGIVGSTPQLSSPIPNVGGVTWMGNAPAPLSPLSQQIMGQSGNMQAAKQNIDRVRAEKGLPSLYNPLPPPPMEEMPKKKKDYSEYAHMEKGGYVKGPQPPHALGNGGRAGGTTDFGPGKGLGVIGGGMQGPLREVVTGGYGAMPARAGRIGYRGTLQERPGSRPSGLAGFYAMQREANLGKAAQTSIDPVTRMSYNPTDRDISAQMKTVGEKYGPREASMLGKYYEGGRTGNFAMQDEARKEIMARRQELQGGIASSKPQIPPMLKRPEYPSSMPDYFGNAMNAAKNPSSPMNLESGGYAKSSPIPVAPTNTGGRNPDGIPVKDAMAKLEHGGANEKVKPYIVNEKGEEAWQPDGEKPQLIPGKEKMVLFPKDGKVIPHGRTMEMAKKGKVEMPEHAADGKPEAKGSKFLPISEKIKSQAENLQSQREDEMKRKNQIEILRDALEAYEKEKATNQFIQPRYAEPISSDAEYEAMLNAYNDLIKSTPQTPTANAPLSEEEDAKLTYQDLPPEVAAPKAPQVPNSPLGPEPITTDYLGNALKAGQELIKTPLGPVSQNRPIASPAPTPEQIKTQTGYTPEEMELLAQGQEMTSRGISQMGPSGVKFASGGGIEGGKAFGPRVVEQQKPVTISPGKIKDELGDVGTRLAKEKEDKEFMKRWESDLASGKAPETEKAFKKPMKLQHGGRTSGYAERREDGGNVKKAITEYSKGQPGLGWLGPKTEGFYNQTPQMALINSAIKYGEKPPILITHDPMSLITKYPHVPMSAREAFSQKWAGDNSGAIQEAIEQQAQMEAESQAAIAARDKARNKGANMMDTMLDSWVKSGADGKPPGRIPLNYRQATAMPDSREIAKSQQADMEKFAKEAMAARNARRGRTKSFTK